MRIIFNLRHVHFGLTSGYTVDKVAKMIRIFEEIDNMTTKTTKPLNLKRKCVFLSPRIEVNRLVQPVYFLKIFTVTCNVEWRILNGLNIANEHAREEPKC